MKKATNPNHGWQTHVVRTVWFRKTKLTGSSCDRCVHFEECRKFNVKNAQAETNYCLWNENRFEKKPKMAGKV